MEPEAVEHCQASSTANDKYMAPASIDDDSLTDVKALTAPPAVTRSDSERVKEAIEQLRRKHDEEAEKLKDLKARLTQLREKENAKKEMTTRDNHVKCN
eukprot:172975-Hanusia_phi.AAC.3